jgi:hypothetical protein
VYDTVIRSGWDSVILGVPFIAMLFCGFFRLDELIASKGQTKPLGKHRRDLSGMDEDGEPIICDPDGRPSTGLRAGR